MASTPHAHHVTPIPVLLRTFFLLLGLMLLTIFAAQAPYWFPGMFGWMIPYWPLTNAIALAIAIAKAVLVISIFMGVKYTTNLVKLYAIGGFVWFLLLYVMLVDYVSRPWEPVRGWEAVPSSGLPRSKESDGGVPYPQFPAPKGKDGHEAGSH